MRKIHLIYYISILVLLSCTENEPRDTKPSHAKIAQANEAYGWSLIGESIIENSPVDKLRLTISKPFGLGGNLFTVSKFGTHFLVCQKEITGGAARKDFNETCKAINIEDYEKIWETLLSQVQEKKKELYPEMLNDYPNAMIEVFIKGKGLTKVETDICETISWPIVLAEQISSSQFEITLPPCPSGSAPND